MCDGTENPGGTMKLVDAPEAVAALRPPTAIDPWRVWISGCLFGWQVGTDGTSYGFGPDTLSWLHTTPKVRLVPACPEHIALGTPRTMPDLHGGDGFDVLEGRARILDEHGEDLTEPLLASVHGLVGLARDEDVDFAVLVDRSGLCGSQVVSTGCRYEEPVSYRRGVGLLTAALLKAHVPVVSQRDFRTLHRLRQRLEPDLPDDDTLLDHHEHPWVVENLPL